MKGPFASALAGTTSLFISSPKVARLGVPPGHLETPADLPDPAHVPRLDIQQPDSEQRARQLSWGQEDAKKKVAFDRLGGLLALRSPRGPANPKV